MDADGCLGIGRIDQAEDPSRLLVNPIAKIADAIPFLDHEIGEVCLRNVGRPDPPSIADD